VRRFARLAALILPAWPMALLGIFLVLLALLANMALLALSSWFITSMAIAGSLALAMDYTTPAAAIRALALARAGGRYAERLVNHDTTLRILSGIRVWLFSRIEPLAPARLEAYRGGDLLSRIRADVDTLDEFYVRGVVPAIVAVLSTACVAGFLARIDVRLAMIDIAGLVAGGFLLPLILGRAGKTPGRERVQRAAELRTMVVEEAQGIAELIALGAVETHHARIEAAGREMDRRQRRLASLQGAAESGLIAAASLALWAAALVMFPAVTLGSLPGADFPMIAVLVLASFESVMPLPGVVQRAGEMAAAAGRLFELIDAKPAVAEPVASAAGAGGAAPALPARVSASLGLRVMDLGFRYTPDGPRVFQGFSMEAPAGSATAVVGPTGMGKSTLVSILLRFWEYQEGSVTLTAPGAAAIDLRSLRTDDARRLFSVMPQSFHLFHSSIRENLAIASPPGSEPADEALFAALECAQLADFVSRLPEGLDTTVGEKGKELSAGQARRIALARALLREAPIYLLDEPTEALDAKTAEALLLSVKARLRGKTLLIVSHRERDRSIVDNVVRVG
jgi:ATP-binding cassette, subfamily C, bacterial CydC